MENIADRINRLIKFLRLSKNAFGEKIGISSSLISQITTKKNNFRADILQKITSEFPQVNSAWLLNGVGDMLLSGLDLKHNTTTNFVKTSEDKDTITLTPLTPRQRLIIERHEEKLLNYIKSEEQAYSELYKNFIKFEDFRDFMQRFSEVYVDDLLLPLYNTSKYLVNDKFNYEDYKNTVIEKFKALEKFNVPLQRLLAAFPVFFDEIAPYDDVKILDNLDF